MVNDNHESILHDYVNIGQRIFRATYTTTTMQTEF